jgi:hypothetical protein
MVISIHIPKTGGTSLGQILGGVYGENLWVNYEFQWNREISFKAFIPSGTKCLHGHFEFDAFDEIYPDALKITWLRDPVERTISLYNHIMNKPDSDNDIIMELYHSKPSLIDFSSIPWVSNNALNYLGDSKPENFAFIGFLESFNESLRMCAKLLNWNQLPESVWKNQGEGKSKSDFPDEVKRAIRKNNMEEYEWREEARRLFSPK